MQRYMPDYELVDVMDKNDRGLWVRFEDAAAEITQLRADLAAMTAQADAEALYSDWLRAELELERGLADRCYAELLTWTGGEDKMDQRHEVELVALYRTRRNK